MLNNFFLSLSNFLLKISDKKAILILTIVGFIVFFNCLSNDFVLEDKVIILNNPSIASLSQIPKLFINDISGYETLSYYRPILFVVFTIIHTFFTKNAFFYHLAQISLAITNSVLLFYFAKNFTTKPLAFMLSLMFLVHPMNVETVAWIASYQDLLFVTFGLLSLNILLYSNLTIKKIFISYFLLFLSILSKETGILFFVMVFIYFLLFQKKKLILPTSLSFLCAFLYILLRNLSEIGISKDKLIPIMDASLSTRLVNIPEILVYYFKLFLFPIKLSIYQSWIVQDVSFNNFYLPLMFVLIISIVFFLLYKITVKNSDKKIRSTIIFFIIWFCIGLTIHLHFVPLDLTVAEHFFYFPMIGLLLFLSIVLENIVHKKRYIVLTLILLFFLCIIFSARSFIRTFDWKNDITILKHDISETPNNYLLQLVYGSHLIELKDYKNGLYYTKKALTNYPKSWISYNNLGVIDYQLGATESAIKNFKKAISIDKYAPSYENIALILIKEKKDEKAYEFIKKGNIDLPSNAKLWLYRTYLANKENNRKDAIMSAFNYYQISKTSQSYNLYLALRNNPNFKLEL